jgi:dTDP-4-amino-4,6-dideoxygalactose transaminase
VTRPTLPSLDELRPLLEEIWERRILTNNGPLHERLEAALSEHLGVAHVSLFANATLALLAALKAIGRTGEIVTTPFSFVASAHAIAWTGNRPVFVDIDPTTLNLDPAAAAAAITADTVAILPVHCYGHVCNVEAIAAVAAARGLGVVYDAAHAFGVRVHGRSVLEYGDLSVLSFHATKVFNTFEGGAVICRSPAMKRWIDRFKNFGIVDETHVESVGFNAKMSELHAAIGLAQLPAVDAMIAARREVDLRYRAALAGVPGIRCVGGAGGGEWNHAYFPIMVDPEYPLDRDALFERLRSAGIFARRYFFPLLSSLPMYADLPSAQPERLPQAVLAASRILCLPIYPELALEDQARIVDLIRGA